MWPQRKTDEPPNPEVKTDPPNSNEKSVAEIIADSLKPISDGLAAMQRDIETLKTPPAPPRKADPADIPSVLDDENAAFNARMTPIMQSQLEMDAKMSRNEVRQEYFDAGFGELWKQREKEIDAQLLASALVQPDGQGGFKKLRGDPQYIRNVVDMIVGRAAREQGIRFDGAKKTFFLETGNSDTRTTPDNPENVEGLTAKQVRLANRLGIPLDKFKQTVSKMEFVS